MVPFNHITGATIIQQRAETILRQAKNDFINKIKPFNQKAETIFMSS